MLDLKKLSDMLSYKGKVTLKATDGSVYRIRVEQDEDAQNPRTDWDNLCHIISVNGDWCIADSKEYCYKRDEFSDVVDDLKAREDIIIKPVYMLDHSGQTISLKDFRDPWDSGICGYIYATKEEAFKWFGIGATEENWKQLAEEAMEGEIKIYDQYIKGEVYLFVVEVRCVVQCKNLRTDTMWTEERWEDVDSCGGFFGYEFDENGMFDYLFENLPDVETLSIEEDA